MSNTAIINRCERETRNKSPIFNSKIMNRKIFAFFISSFLFSGLILAQTEKNNTQNVGFDLITQGFYWGIDYRIKDYSIGVDVGSSLGLLVPPDISLCVDNALYFGKANKFDKKTWHINARIAYSKVLVYSQENLLFLVPAIGKTFYINDKLGINVELGYSFELLNDWGKGMLGGPSTIHLGGMSIPNQAE